jgi:hypothetical protein
MMLYLILAALLFLCYRHLKKHGEMKSTIAAVDEKLANIQKFVAEHL